MVTSFLVAIILAGAIGGGLYTLWFRSNWRAEQIIAIELLDRLISRVISLAHRPDSGLLAADLGDLRGDWHKVKGELSEQYGFESWLRSGRKTHAIEDPYARALSNFARRRVDPLHAVLSSHSVGPLKSHLVAEIFDVLSVNIDELAERNTKVVQMVSPGRSDLVNS